MKRIIVLILICILMAGCSGTGPSEAESKTDAAGITDITLPSTLTMDLIMPKAIPIRSITEVNSEKSSTCIIKMLSMEGLCSIDTRRKIMNMNYL